MSNDFGIASRLVPAGFGRPSDRHSLRTTNRKEFGELLSLITICQLAASVVFLRRLVFEGHYFSERPDSLLLCASPSYGCAF